MRTDLSRRGLITLIGAAPLFAGDSWVNHSAADWDEKQIDKILTDSPWSKKVTASSGEGASRGRRGRGGTDAESGGGITSASGMNRPGTAMPDEGGISGGGGRGGRGGGGGGLDAESIRTAGPSMNVTVRWLSALPVQQAIARKTNHVASAASMSAYIIGMYGLPAALAQRPEGELKQMLKDVTSLRIKGRDPLVPEQVEVGTSGHLAAVIFHFSKKEPISLDDKEVEFASRLGPFEFKCKFKTKDMTFDGKLAV